MKVNKKAKSRRKIRISSRYFGTVEVPRLVVYRSNRFIFAQAIDDKARKTLASFGSLQLRKEKGYKKDTKTAESRVVGQYLGKILLKKNIEKIVFDRGCYAYLGRVAALAEGLREVGIKF